MTTEKKQVLIQRLNSLEKNLSNFEKENNKEVIEGISRFRQNLIHYFKPTSAGLNLLALTMLTVFVSCSFKSPDKQTKTQSRTYEEIKPADLSKMDTDGDRINDLEENVSGLNPFVADIPELRVRFLQNYAIKVNWHVRTPDGTDHPESAWDFTIDTKVGHNDPDFKYRVGEILVRNKAFAEAARVELAHELPRCTISSATSATDWSVFFDALSNKASDILEKKGIAPKVSHLSQNGNFSERMKQKGNDAKHAFMATTMKEKVVLGADAVLNRNENKLASSARKQDVWAVKDHPQVKDDIIPLSSYKREALDFKKKEGGLQGNIDFNKSKFMEFHRNEGARTHSIPRNSEGFHFTEGKWKALSPQARTKVKEEFGLSQNFKGREGFIYFPKGEGKRPMPAHVFHRTMKPKTLKELRDEKRFL